MKREKVRNRLTGGLLLALGVLLILGSLAAVLAAVSCFDAAWHVRELYPWLVSEAEPDAEGAMNTLEEMQFKWILGGIVCLLPGLGGLAGGVVLTRQGWKRRSKGRDRPSNEENRPWKC